MSGGQLAKALGKPRHAPADRLVLAKPRRLPFHEVKGALGLFRPKVGKR